MSLEIITAGLTGALSGAAISFLLKTWFKTRLENSIKHEYDKKLYKHKSQIEQSIGVANFIHATNINRTQVSYEKSIEAIDKLWCGLLEINSTKPLLLTYADLLVDEEFGVDFGTCDVKHFPEIFDSDITKMMADSFELEKHRLYCGEHLWSIFFMYRQLIGRVSVLIKKGREQGNVPHWWKDQICLFIIDTMLCEQEKVEFLSQKAGKLSWLTKNLEKKYLTSANKVIVGDESISYDIERSLAVVSRLEEALRKQKS
ncbi:hypothetical protein [Vibrio sp. TBV020]